jgi:hypothetical protein
MTKYKTIADGGHKPGSRIALVHEKFDAEGAEAALALGISLGLATSTIRTWVKQLSGAAGQPRPAAVATVKVNGSKEPGPVEMVSKKLLTVKYIKGAQNKAYLLQQGPQVSLVRWKHNGADQAISNEWLNLPVLREEIADVERG